MCGILATAHWKRVVHTSLNLLMITLFQTDTCQKDLSCYSSRYKWKCHLKEKLALSSRTLRVPVLTKASLIAFSLKTATIICLKNSFSLAVDISPASLNALRNGLLCSSISKIHWAWRAFRLLIFKCVLLSREPHAYQHLSSPGCHHTVYLHSEGKPFWEHVGPVRLVTTTQEAP